MLFGVSNGNIEILLLVEHTGVEDLVYLAGGENREFEVAEFPTLNKRMVRMGQQVDIYDADDAKGFGPL